MNVPETRYAKSGDLHIAYQVLGDGPVDLIYVPGWVSQLDLYWEEPSVARFFRSLASFSRLILFDRRGLGLSDRVTDSALPTLEERMDDLRAVLDAAESSQAAVMGQGYGSPIAILFAATYPARTSTLVLYTPVAKAGLKTDDYPWGSSAEEEQAWLADSTERWGSQEFAAEWLQRLAPTLAEDRRSIEWVAKMMRAAASPAASRSLSEMNALMDVREILPLVSVPTLVLEREEVAAPKGGIDAPPLEEARYVASRIPDAKLVVLPGRDYFPWVGDQEAVVAEVADFVSGARYQQQFERVLLTVLFTDIVASTRRAAELGDRRWRALLEEHNARVRRALDGFRGTEVDRTGDGFLATFDGPARAIRCARSVVSEVRELGLEIRAGIHAGEVELVESGVGGIAVHVGARVAAKAKGGEVLVTRTVMDLVAGSGIEFAARGTHTLKGISGRWPLFAATADSRSF
jgi:class 3 adenylate cyclase